MGLVAESIVSDVMEMGNKAVQLRAVREGWPSVKTHKQGGGELHYVRELLPMAVRNELIQRESMVPAMASRSLVTDRPVPKRSQKLGLAKYQVIHAFRIVKETAPWGGKSEAAQAFMLAYNAGVLMPQVYEILGPIQERTLDNLDKKLRSNKDNYLCLCDGRGGWKKHGTNNWKGRSLGESSKAAFLNMYLHPARPSVIMSIKAAKLTLERHGNPEAASEKTFRRWLKDFEQHNSHVICLAREGMKAYIDKYGPYATRDSGLLEVGQCLVADGKTLNFFIRHPETGRPCRMTLIVFLDWASRYPVGWQIMPSEDALAIMAAFRNAVETLGMYPQCVYLDNGRAFKSKVFTNTDPDLEALVGLYGRVGTAVTFAKPYNGRAKVVERWFQTVQEQVEFMMPSFCGDSIQTKPAWMNRNEKFHKAWHEARTNNWIPTIREAAHILGAYFQWYGRQPHSDLPGTPEEILLAHLGPGVDPVQLNHDFLWRKEVIPHHCRITLWGIDYESDGLHGMSKNNKIVVMYDTASMNRVWCYTMDGCFLCEAYPVEALHPLARLFGDEVSMAQVKSHNKRLGQLRKETCRQLADAGISKETQDSLGILPFAAKIPILPQECEATQGMEKFAARNRDKKQVDIDISKEEIKRLELIVEQAYQDAEVEPEIPRPKYWNSDLEHYEWAWRLIHEHGRNAEEGDLVFMDEFENKVEFANYRQRFDDLKQLFF